MARPTLYRPEYCDEIIKFCADTGKSMRAFAGSIGVSHPAIMKWRKVHPDFDEACEVASACRTNTLETQLLESANAAAINARVLMLKQIAPEYREKMLIDHSSEDGSMATKPNIDVSKLSVSAMREIMEASDKAENESN